MSVKEMLVGLTMLVTEDIDWRPHTIIKQGETVKVERSDDIQVWLQPAKLHWGLSRWNNEFSVDFLDEETLGKLTPI